MTDPTSVVPEAALDAIGAIAHRPAGDPAGVLLLTHGAGSDRNSPLLVALCDEWARRGWLAVVPWATLAVFLGPVGSTTTPRPRAAFHAASAAGARAAVLSRGGRGRRCCGPPRGRGPPGHVRPS